MPGQTPEQVEQALYKEIEKLQDAPVDDRELQKVKNQFAADSFRRLQSNFALMFQLLWPRPGAGGRVSTRIPKRIEAVTPADIQRVAQRLPRARAARGDHLLHEAGARHALTRLSKDCRTRKSRRCARCAPWSGRCPVDQAKQFLQKLEAEEGRAPADKRRLLDAMKAVLQERITKGAPQ